MTILITNRRLGPLAWLAIFYVVIVVGYWAFRYQLGLRASAELQSEIEEQEKELSKAKLVRERRDAFDVEQQRLADELAKLDLIMPRSVAAGSLQARLRALVEESGVQMGAVGREVPTAQEFFCETRVAFELSASQEGLGSLWNRTAEQHTLTKITEVDVELEPEGTVRGTAVLSGYHSKCPRSSGGS